MKHQTFHQVCMSYIDWYCRSFQNRILVNVSTKWLYTVALEIFILVLFRHRSIYYLHFTEGLSFTHLWQKDLGVVSASDGRKRRLFAQPQKFTFQWNLLRKNVNIFANLDAENFILTLKHIGVICVTNFIKINEKWKMVFRFFGSLKICESRFSHDEHCLKKIRGIACLFEELWMPL